MGSSSSIVVRLTAQLKAELTAIATDAVMPLSHLVVELIEKGLASEVSRTDRHSDERQARELAHESRQLAAQLAQLQQRLDFLEVRARAFAGFEAPVERDAPEAGASLPTSAPGRPSPWPPPAVPGPPSVATSPPNHVQPLMWLEQRPQWDDDPVLAALRDFAE